MSTQPNLPSISHALGTFFQPGDFTHLRALKDGQPPVGMISQDHSQLAAKAEALNAKGYSIYFGVNPGDQSTPAPINGCPSSANVTARRWIPVDVDAHGADDPGPALETASRIADWVRAETGVESVQVATGRGAAIFIPCAIPATPTTDRLVAALLERLHGLFSLGDVTVDTAVADRARIMRLPGTVHPKAGRLCTIIAAPTGDHRLTQAELESLAGPVEPLPAAEPDGQSDALGRVEAFLDGAEWFHRPVKRRPNGSLAIPVRCPWGADHSTPDRAQDAAAVIVSLAGTVSFVCHHSACAERRWEDFRRCLESTGIRFQTPAVPEVEWTRAGETPLPGDDEFLTGEKGRARWAFARLNPPVRYVPGMDQWRECGAGNIWTPIDPESVAYRLSDLISHHAQTRAAEAEGGDRKVWSTAVRQSSAGPANRSVARMAAIVADDARRNADQFDSLATQSLALQNGILDLATGHLRPIAQADYITLVSPVDFDPEARNEAFERAVEFIAQGDADYFAYLRRWMGRLLCPNMGDKQFYLLVGPPHSGKTTLMESIARVLGPLATAAVAETFTRPGADRANEAREDLVVFRGRRFVYVSELEDGNRLNSSVTKRLTGGDTITARQIRGHIFSFRPTWAIAIGSNVVPRMDANDPGLWARVRVLPFFTAMPKDELGNPVHASWEAPEGLSGILRYLVDGYHEYLRDGLGSCAAVDRATERAQQREGSAESFVALCPQSADCSVPAADLYAAYTAYCEANGVNALSNTAFGNIAGRLFPKVRKNSGNCYTGIGLPRAN